MPEVSDSIMIGKPTAEVFAAIENPEVQITYDGEMFKGVEKLTDGPIGKGTRFRGTFKGMGKVEYSYDEFEPNHLIQHAVKMPFGPFRHRFEITAEGDSSRLTQSISVEPNILGRIMWPLIMRRMMRSRVSTLNGLVKSYVERRA